MTDQTVSPVTETVPEVQDVTPEVAPARTRTTATCYDPTLRYMRMPEKSPRGHISFNIRKIISDTAANRERTARVTLPVVISYRDKQHGGTTTQTALWEARDPNNTMPWSIIIGAPSGSRSRIAHILRLNRPRDNDLLTHTGRRVLVEVMPRSLVLIATKPRWNEIQFVVYRIDDLYPWPGECPQTHNGRDQYGVADMTLIAVRKADRFAADNIWTHPDLASAAASEDDVESRRATRVLQGINDMVEVATNNLLYPEQTLPYIEFFSYARHQNNVQFEIPEGGVMNTTTATPEGFMSVATELFKTYRDALVEHLQTKMARSLPCSVHYEVIDNGEDAPAHVRLAVEVPANDALTDEQFKSFEIVTILKDEELPQSLVEESALLLRAKTLSDLIGKIGASGAVTKNLFSLL